MKKDVAIRSSAGEYLSYIASTGNGSETMEVLYYDESIWMTQKMIATLYDVTKQNINQHIQKIYEDNELDKTSTIKNFLTVQKEGNRSIERELLHYNLQVIIAVGFKVNSPRAVQFRKWVNEIANTFTIKGWVIDAPRLKEGTYLSDKYFEEQLEKIREIRASERKFYQKITDIYSTAIDYDKTAGITREFFAKVQNKMHYAVHGHTAAELIFERADSKQPHMGLTTWKDSPDGKIIPSDVVIAKNYLSQEEMESLSRIVSAYLDLAEDRAKRKIPMTMEDWAKRLDIFLMADDREILKGAGKISAKIAEDHAKSEFEKYRIIQDKEFLSDYDKYLLELSETIKK